MGSSAVVDPALADRYRAAGWWPGEALADRYSRLVDADPSATAVVDGHRHVLTRRQLWDRAAELAAELRDRGVDRGSVVLVYLPNRSEWQVTLLACLRLGAVPATLPMTTDESTLAHVCGVVGARALVTVPEHRGRSTADLARRALGTVGHGTDLLVLADDGGRRWSTQLGGPAPTAPEGVDHLMFTSSTTGRPKAVMHTSDTLAAVNLGFVERFGITEQTPLFMPSPLGHSVGAWHGGRLSLFTGAPLVLQDTWDPQVALRLVHEHRCAFTAAATPYLKDLVDAPWDGPEPKLASLRTFLCGGAPVPPALVEQALVELPHTFVTVLWGMTEGGVTTSVPGDDPARTARLAGRPLPGLELRTLSGDGQTPAEEGELAMRGPGVFVGYLGQEDLYRDQVTPDGFFRTGDLARIEPDGYLALTGRLKDLIIRGGVNISPVPLEDALSAHPGIKRVAVIGVPDERLGERICAVVVPTAGTDLQLADVVQWLTDRGHPQRLLPERLEVVPDMPVTAAGKIRKVDLRTQVVVGR